MFLAKSINYYKREDVQEEMVQHAKDKELGVRFGDGFGKRPEVLHYPQDVMEFAKNRASSFHVSEELWNNPLHLKTDMSRRELDELRKGWDLVLDIDCSVFEYSKIAAYYTIHALQHHDIKSVSCKFSGNKGFHIGVPFESFPEKIGGTETRLLFPEAPKRIAEYMKFLIKEKVEAALLKLEKGNLDVIAEKTGVEKSKLTTDGSLNTEEFLAIDTILISSRHMYRMPYSLHEKSGLVSLPLPLDSVLAFNRQDAVPEKVGVKEHFLNREADRGEASMLIIQAFDFHAPKSADEDDKSKKQYKDFEQTEAIPESFFPPCIHNIKKGVKDGRKRSIFILRNFLGCVGWDKDKIKEYIYEWNKNSSNPLREVALKGQIRQIRGKVPPPNCDNVMYYKDFGVCTPDNFCRRIKNPCQYSKFKVLLSPKKRVKKKAKKE